MFNKFKQWCAADTTAGRLTRTIFQGIISAVILYVPDLITGSTIIPNEYKPFCVAALMAVLSPMQSELGKTLE